MYRGDSEQARTGFNWLPVTGPGTGHRRHHHGQLGLAVWVLVLVYARLFPKIHGAPSRLLQQTSQFWIASCDPLQKQTIKPESAPSPKCRFGLDCVAISVRFGLGTWELAGVRAAVVHLAPFSWLQLGAVSVQLQCKVTVKLPYSCTSISSLLCAHSRSSPLAPGLFKPRGAWPHESHILLLLFFMA